jgi:hypothetical protein
MPKFTENIMNLADYRSPKNNIGRNDPCPCGSGKKYKKCCLNNDNNSLLINKSLQHSDIKQLEPLYSERNSWRDQELATRSFAEAAYDDVILACLQEGKSIDESIKAANAQYPDEALQINENNLNDLKAHYEYLFNHLIIKDKFTMIDKACEKSNQTIDTVNFITYEESDDLVVSFSFDEDTEFGVNGFMIHRCPKYELFLRPFERGPYIDWTDDDVIILVKSVKINPQRVEIGTTRASYLFDLAKVSPEDYRTAVRVLKKMNFDGIYHLEME